MRALAYMDMILRLGEHGRNRGRPNSLAKRVLWASRVPDVVLRLEVNTVKDLSEWHRVRETPSALEIPPRVPARVVLLIWEMETLMLMVGCRPVPNRLDRRKTRLLATETMPAGTQVDILPVPALMTGRFATELLFRLLEIPV